MVYVILESDVPASDFNDLSKNYFYFYKENQIVLTTRDIPEDWVVFRRQVMERLHALYKLDCYAKYRTAIIENFYNTPLFTSIVATELLKCDSKNGVYSPAVIEWAEIQDIPVETAYREMKIQYQDISMVYIRNNAIYLKFARLINQTTDADELNKIVLEAHAHFTLNASI